MGQLRGAPHVYYFQLGPCTLVVGMIDGQCGEGGLHKLVFILGTRPQAINFCVAKAPPRQSLHPVRGRRPQAPLQPTLFLLLPIDHSNAFSFLVLERRALSVYL